MPKIPTTSTMTMSEWNALPVLFGCDALSKLVGCTRRYVSDHAADEFGGVMAAGRWQFSKPHIAHLLKLEVNS